MSPTRLLALFLLLVWGTSHAQTLNRTSLMNAPLPLFYRELVAFDIEAHARLRLPATPPDYRFAAETNVIPLLINEVPLALQHYPIVFLPGSAKEPPTLAALVGVGDGKNQFVDAKGQWRRDTYIPAWVRRYPFIAVKAEGQADPVLALDPQAALLKATKGDALVKDGKPTPRLDFIIAFQKEFQELALRTQALARALNDAGVLEEGTLRIEPRAGDKTAQPREIRGFYIVSEARLRSLSDTAIVALHKADALGLAYAQLFSVANLGKVMAESTVK